jgi:hypothetical protein
MRANLAALLACGCATTPAPAPTTPGSRGMRASDHIQAAHEQDELARQALAYPDVRAGGETQPIAFPWARTWDTRIDHERLAQLHRSAAAQLHAEYDEACRGLDSADVSISPLARFAIGGTPIPTGMVIYLSPRAGAPDHLLAAMRCHRAWMMLAPTGMDDCPLDLADIHVTARGTLEEIEVTITVSDPSLVGELQRRAAREIEHAEHEHLDTAK